MLNLQLVTTSGVLNPPGVAPSLDRGAQKATLQFVTGSVAALLSEGAPIALKIFSPADLDHPLATFSAWTRNAAWQCYTAVLDTLATDLAWKRTGTLLGQISYGDPTVNSSLFHVRWAEGGDLTAAPVTPIVITQPAGPVKITPLIGYFQGKLATGQVEGRWVAPAPTELDGFDLRAQVDPLGAPAIVEAVVNGVPAARTSQLPAGSKGAYQAFSTVLPLVTGDVVQYQLLQVGSTRAGSYLTVSARGRLV